MKKLLLLSLSHSAVLVVGFVLGVYFLPIMIAPESPSNELIDKVAQQAKYHTNFVEDRGDSDGFHWAEGKVYVSDRQIAFKGTMAPGPDYKLYLAPSYIETEDEFLGGVKALSVRVDVVKTFDGFIIDVPQGVNIEDYDTVVVWCEQYSEYISSAKYRG